MDGQKKDRRSAVNVSVRRDNGAFQRLKIKVHIIGIVWRRMSYELI
jgi:hypothetical protein